jgi:hypothetical protein
MNSRILFKQENISLHPNEKVGTLDETKQVKISILRHTSRGKYLINYQ